MSLLLHSHIHLYETIFITTERFEESFQISRQIGRAGAWRWQQQKRCRRPEVHAGVLCRRLHAHGGCRLARHAHQRAVMAAHTS
jgi:hypothetical protein